MSLKAVHILVILSSTLFCLGFGAFEIRVGARTGAWLDLALGGVSVVAGLLLTVYFQTMLRKLRGISYL